MTDSLTSDRKKLLAGTSYAFSGSLISNGLIYVFGIVFARIFGAKNAGLFFLALVTMQILSAICRVGLPEGVITNYHYILSANSIDETIHSRLIEKERRMLELIESQDIPLISENLNYDIGV